MSFSRAQALAELRTAFRAAGIAEADLDASRLLEEAAGIDATELALRPHEALGKEASEKLADWRTRRLDGEPVGRILGRRAFWGHDFRLGPAVLEPRPDSETLVEAALALIRDRNAPCRILDLGTGSGCLLVALLGECPNAWGIGIDRAPEALLVARENARAAGIGDRAAFLAGDWAAALDARFDLVVSNPPYIRSAEIAGLAREVRLHDPPAALDGGADGLDAYRAILADAPRLLAEGGVLALEIGHDQGAAVAALAAGAGLTQVAVARDLGGRERVVTARSS